LLARQGIAGPPEVFEGKKGFIDAIAGPFHLEWSQENLERVTRTILKKYNAEIHSQSALEGILELQAHQGFSADDIRHIDIEIFDVAYHIIGGGDEGNKTIVRTKEEADHSLPYMLAVALLDGQVMPEQYRPERIQRSDVQELLRKITVHPNASFTERFPEEMPCRLKVIRKDGNELVQEKQGYEGFVTTPMSWETVVKKFEHLSQPYTDAAMRGEIVEAVRSLETIQVEDLTRLLARVQPPEG
jgi:2-methylcitrate dehydratase